MGRLNDILDDAAFFERQGTPRDVINQGVIEAVREAFDENSESADRIHELEKQVEGLEDDVQSGEETEKELRQDIRDLENRITVLENERDDLARKLEAKVSA